jgi:rRNA processing protein Krr1/Pno1
LSLLIIKYGNITLETDRFFAASGVQLSQTDRGLFHFRRAAFVQHLKNRVGVVLAKETDLRITLNLDGVTITSKSHTHPSHSQTSRLLTSSLSLGVPVPRATQCM